MPKRISRFVPLPAPLLLATALATALAMALLVASGQQAWAACHAFTVSAEPADVIEGETVTVTVRRDAAVMPSSIDVTTVDESAAAGVDYEALGQTADFPDGGTAQTFTVATFDRAGTQGPRTFRVELSNPQGCEVNQNFEVGDPAVVTIVDADEPEPVEEDPVDPVDEPVDEPVEVEDEPEEPAAPIDEPLAATGPHPVLVLSGLVLLALAALTAPWRRRPPAAFGRRR